MNILFFAALLIFVLYMGRLLLYGYCWKNTPEFVPEPSTIECGITVIIPFRNEETNIMQLLDDIVRQNYPPDKMEIILVDDHSDDRSASQVIPFCATYTQFKYLINAGSGKKAALRTAIECATNEQILLTDADCRVTPLWVKSFAASFMQSDADLILGLVDISSGHTWCSRFQEAEFLSLIAAGTGAAACGSPIYGNGASLAFRKSVYQSIHDAMQEQVVSGDDTFLIHNARAHHKKIRVLKSKSALVTTQPQDSWGQYFQQRIRWVSKSRYYRDLGTIATAASVLMMNLVLLFFLLLLCLKENPGLFVIFFVLKTCTDYIFLSRFLTFYKKQMPVFRFVVFALIYPFLVIIWTFRGFMGTYQWKGRTYQAG